MNIDDYMFMSNLPTLDLHGYDRETARVEINDFIRDLIIQKQEFGAIIHGVGTGIIRKTTVETLNKNKNVVKFKSSYFNQGMTVIQINLKK